MRTNKFTPVCLIIYKSEILMHIIWTSILKILSKLNNIDGSLFIMSLMLLGFWKIESFFTKVDLPFINDIFSVFINSKYVPFVIFQKKNYTSWRTHNIFFMHPFFNFCLNECIPVILDIFKTNKYNFFQMFNFLSFTFNTVKPQILDYRYSFK